MGAKTGLRVLVRLSVDDPQHRELINYIEANAKPMFRTKYVIHLIALGVQSMQTKGAVRLPAADKGRAEPPPAGKARRGRPRGKTRQPPPAPTVSDQVTALPAIDTGVGTLMDMLGG